MGSVELGPLPMDCGVDIVGLMSVYGALVEKMTGMLSDIA